MHRGQKITLPNTNRNDYTQSLRQTKMKVSIPQALAKEEVWKKTNRFSKTKKNISKHQTKRKTTTWNSEDNPTRHSKTLAEQKTYPETTVSRPGTLLGYAGTKNDTKNNRTPKRPLMRMRKISQKIPFISEIKNTGLKQLLRSYYWCQQTQLIFQYWYGILIEKNHNSPTN